MDETLSAVQKAIRKHLLGALAASEPPSSPVSPVVLWPQEIRISQLAYVVGSFAHVDLHTQMCMLGVGIQYPAQENISMRTGRGVHAYILPQVVREVESAVCEVPVRREIEGVALVGRADLVVGDWVIELKTTRRSPFPNDVARLQVSLYASLLDRKPAIAVANLDRLTVDIYAISPSDLLLTAEVAMRNYNFWRTKIERGNCVSCGLSHRCGHFLIPDPNSPEGENVGI